MAEFLKEISVAYSEVEVLFTNVRKPFIQSSPPHQINKK